MKTKPASKANNLSAQSSAPEHFTHSLHVCLLIGAVALTPLPHTAEAGGIFSSLEQFNFQSGEDLLLTNRYEAFDELDELPGVTGYTVSVNGGPAESIEENPEFDNARKRRLAWPTLAEMLAERPIGATYTHTLSGNPAGTVVIESPDVAYEAAIPAKPAFTINGIEGIWRKSPYSPDGAPLFQFDPTGVSSFTVTMNAYNVPGPEGTEGEGVQGELFVSSLSITNTSAGGASIGNVGVLGDEPQESGTPTAPLTITFILGAPADGGDSDPHTFGLSPNDTYELEGEFVNVFGLTAAGSGALATHDKAFVYQNVTSLTLLAGSLPLLATTYERFMLDDGYDPAGIGLPEADADGDGVKNAIKWAIGGVLGESAVSKLPVATLVSADPSESGTPSDYLLFSYRRNIAAHADSATTLFVTHGTDLANAAAWATAEHGVDGVVIEEVPNAFEIGIDEVRVYIPTSGDPEGRRFVRLNVEIGEAAPSGISFGADSGDFSGVLAGTYSAFVDGNLDGTVSIQSLPNIDLAWNGITIKANQNDINNGEDALWLARSTTGSIYTLFEEGVDLVPPALFYPAAPFLGQTWTNEVMGETRELEIISMSATSPGGITGCVLIRETNPGDWSEDMFFKNGQFVGNIRTDLTGNDPVEQFYRTGD
ncbi:MAG: hypothetical protein ACNA77_10475 [Opitutales bacterium]